MEGEASFPPPFAGVSFSEKTPARRRPETHAVRGDTIEPP